MSSVRIEIIKELRALEQFCTFKAVRTGEESERFLKDYLADVQEFPLDAIQKACGKWRKSGATKFPTPGQLIPLIRECLPAEGGVGPQAWRPLSDGEYADLSLRDKIRHQQILAHEARVKAGPMWKTPPGSSLKRPRAGHIEPAELSPVYRQWMDIAAEHDAEVRRLRSYLHRSPLAAA